MWHFGTWFKWWTLAVAGLKVDLRSLFRPKWLFKSIGILAGHVKERFFCQVSYAASLYMSESSFLKTCSNSRKSFASLHVFDRDVSLVILADTATEVCLHMHIKYELGHLLRKKTKYVLPVTVTFLLY